MYHRLWDFKGLPFDVWNVGNVSAKQFLRSRRISGRGSDWGGSDSVGGQLFYGAGISEKRNKYYLRKERAFNMAEVIRVENVTKRFGDGNG